MKHLLKIVLAVSTLLTGTVQAAVIASDDFIATPGSNTQGLNTPGVGFSGTWNDIVTGTSPWVVDTDGTSINNSGTSWAKHATKRQLTTPIDMTQDGEWKITFTGIKANNDNFFLGGGLLSSSGGGIWGGNAYDGLATKGLSGFASAADLPLDAEFQAGANGTSFEPGTWTGSYTMEVLFQKTNSGTTDDIAVTIQSFNSVGTMINSRTVNLSGFSQVADYLAFEVSDGSAINMSFDSISLTGEALSPDAPYFTSTPLTRPDIVATVPFNSSIAADAVDPNSDPLTFGKSGGPGWLNVAADGTLSGTPSPADIGNNSFIVSVHDGSETNFANLSISVTDGSSAANLFGKLSTWKYYDTGEPNGSWTSEGYNDNSWPSGLGGFADNDVTEIGTALAVGVDTVYFRKEFTLANASVVKDIIVNARYDDGIVVYINGVEVQRPNMPAGDVITHTTLATVTVGGTDEDAFTASNADLSGVTLNEGANTIAVSLHNVLTTSSDLIFDMELSATWNNPNAPLFSTDPIIANTATATVEYLGSIAGTATDVNSDPITYHKLSGPDWLNVAADGTLSGTPAEADFGVKNFTVYASDGVDGYSEATLTIDVRDANGNPAEPPSDTDHYRIIWDDSPTSKATICWKQLSGNNGTVYYGTTDFGRAYANYPNQKSVDKVGNFTVDAPGIQSCFARLTGLQPDTAYYFVIKDDSGVSERFWFLTAPDTIKPFTFIGGGDSRSNPTPRQKANRMVAKLRPLFVLFTGDMINTSTTSQWNSWFTDWQETICSDGRIIPLIPYRGNHEGKNASGNDATDNPAFFELFDTTAENYFSFSVGGTLMRIYVLNSEMDNNATKWNAQTDWLTADLVANSGTHTHMVAGYHKPMRPHNAAKTDGNNEYNAWAQPFYDNSMDLVFEADSHCVKRTWPVRPGNGQGADQGFIRDDANGMVFSGEGCWGAPLRANDDIKSWTRDSGMFNSFDWVHVYPSYMELYTIKVDNEGTVGSLEEGDVFSLPANIDLWKPSNGTRVVINNQNAASLKSYAQWQLDQWGSGAIPADTEALADYDGDGYNNLTEFAYGLDPQSPTPADDGIFPVLEITGADIKFNHRRNPDTSLTYKYEFSSDLITWSPMVDGIDYSASTAPTGSYEQITIDLIGNNETQSNGFIRVKVGIQ
ncbi:MAG TPA: fibronectin type III domain-containing protein [Pontiella sp.]